jgi:glutathione synthase/RimK-type ligase-like ATP-grasp enzyme
MKLVFATHAAQPSLAADDVLALPALSALGFEVVASPWDAAPVAADATVTRSCWDYHRRPQAFAAWVLGLVGRGVPLVNPAQLLLWNLRKTYLRDLEAQGAAVPPTAWVPAGDPRSLADVLAQHGLDAVVVKPVVSLSGEDTWRSSRAAVAGHEPAWRALVASRDLMVQAFLSEIASEGETSLVFFAGAFSHAVRKTPRAGEFRVQSDHGGTRVAAAPTPACLAEAQRLIAGLSPAPTFARVDLVPHAGRWFVMELELIDPELFFAFDPASPDRFARTLAAALRTAKTR